MYISKGLGRWKIASDLNRRGVPTARGPEWSSRCQGVWQGVTVENILRNPAYTGDLVWNRRTLAKFYRIEPQGAVERHDVDLRRTSRNDVPHAGHGISGAVSDDRRATARRNEVKWAGASLGHQGVMVLGWALTGWR